LLTTALLDGVAPIWRRLFLFLFLIFFAVVMIAAVRLFFAHPFRPYVKILSSPLRDKALSGNAEITTEQELE